jgi:hypothetical protein
VNKEEHECMSAAPEPSIPPLGDLEAAADQAIAACGGDAREAVTGTAEFEDNARLIRQTGPFIANW